MNTSTQGSCMCGAVRVEIDHPVRFCAHCHCESCRRAHGAPVVTWTGVPDAQFRVLEGSDRLRRYESSAETFRSFCSTCGTTLLFESSKWAGEVHVAVANLEGPPMEPQGHAFYAEHVDWLKVADPPED